MQFIILFSDHSKMGGFKMENKEKDLLRICVENWVNMKHEEINSSKESTSSEDRVFKK